MVDRSPLWPAQLDHIRIDSEQPGPLIGFYRDAMGMTRKAPSGERFKRVHGVSSKRGTRELAIREAAASTDRPRE